MSAKIITPAELPTVIGRAKFAAANFAGWRKDSQRAAAAFTKRAEAWKFKRDLKATLNYTVAKVQKLDKPGCTYNGQWIVVVEHAAIPDGAPDRFFGSIMQADVKLQSVYRTVKNA